MPLVIFLQCFYLSLKDYSFIAYQVQKSHYPRTFTGLKEGEATSYENARTLVITITTCVCLFSLLETIFYLLFNTAVNITYFFSITFQIIKMMINKVHPWKKIIQEEQRESSEAQSHSGILKKFADVS